jgi:hypothetical protein
MLNIYLYVNAVIYVVFAAWCTVAPMSTARNLGYESLSSSGLSEYVVVYGGLQLGLGLFFAWCVQAGLQRAGLVLALALYVPIVLYRCISVARQWPVASTTLVVGALEFALLLCAGLLYWRTRT